MCYKFNFIIVLHLFLFNEFFCNSLRDAPTNFTLMQATSIRYQCIKSSKCVELRHLGVFSSQATSGKCSTLDDSDYTLDLLNSVNNILSERRVAYVYPQGSLSLPVKGSAYVQELLITNEFASICTPLGYSQSFHLPSVERIKALTDFLDAAIFSRYYYVSIENCNNHKRHIFVIILRAAGTMVFTIGDMKLTFSATNSWTILKLHGPIPFQFSGIDVLTSSCNSLITYDHKPTTTIGQRKLRSLPSGSKTYGSLGSHEELDPLLENMEVP